MASLLVLQECVSSMFEALKRLLCSGRPAGCRSIYHVPRIKEHTAAADDGGVRWYSPTNYSFYHCSLKDARGSSIG